LRKPSREGVDGVFLDVKMPEMSGAETLEKIRKRDGETPIIITSFLTRDAVIEALAKGANHMSWSRSNGKS
jgi:DNA-binding NarL/FixJ family response regulator